MLTKGIIIIKKVKPMKPNSLKVKMQSISQIEMQNTKGGLNTQEKLKTVVVTGKKKNASMVF